MKSKRFLTVLLAACMLLTLMPAVTPHAMAATNSDPDYNRAGTPEVAIFNAYTGASDKFFESQMSSHFYNAVAAGKFKKSDNNFLSYEVKVSDNSTYVWQNFYDSNLAYLSDKYQQLQAGYSVSRTSNSHTHRWSLFYSADMTSYMNSSLYLNDTTNKQYWSVVDHRGFYRSASTMRDGKMKFQPLGYTVNGANSRYMTVGGVAQKDIRKSMYISFVNSTLHYDGQNKTCSCGGSATGAVVSFYDGTAPVIQSVEIKNGSTASTNLKAGDTVTIVLNCSEAIRFADDSAAGKGDVYIGLMVEGQTDRLPAHLTSLDGETLTFTYTVPQDDTSLYTITGIDLKSAPSGGTALVHSSADITLKQVYGGSGNKTYTASKPSSVSSELGFSKTTSQVTDMAGNALTNSVPATSFYIDCERPYVAVAGLSANTNNGDVKAILGKTDMAPNTANYEDNSDIYLGAGDSFSLTLYMNEVVTGSNAAITTNIKKSDSSYLTLNVTSSGTTDASGIGTQYGKGASRGKLSVLNTAPVTIEDGMTIEGTEGIKITGVSFSGVTDASGNSAKGTAKSPDKNYYIDTAGPGVAFQAAVQSGGVNSSFYVPFTVTDAASGVAGLPASLTVRAGYWTSKFQYAVTTSTQTPGAWSDGAMGTAIPFTQTGTQQYLHIRPSEGEFYAIYGNARVVFNLADFAGNTGTAEAPLTGVLLDTNTPVATAGDSTRSYDNTASQGTLTVTINASDQGGLASVQYQWTEPETSEPTDGWSNAVGTLDGNPINASMTAEASVASGESFRKLLWAKVTDAAGNSSVTNLGEYSYNLAGIEYILDYSPAVSTSARVTASSLDAGGRLVLDVRKAGSDTHYVTVAESAGDTNIFDGAWYTAIFSDASGYSFTGLEEAGDFLSGFTGNLYVTVYSGNGETITQTADEITATTNAGTESFTLRVSPSDNAASDVFSGTSLLSADADTLSAITAHVEAYPWSYGSGSSVSSTLEGVQLSIALGDDKNGWDYADIDWESSFIALYPASVAAPDTLEGLRAARLCGIGSGPSQTVTLPAGNYASGSYNLALVLVRNSDPAAFYAAELQDGGTGARIYLDVTEPGSLTLGVMVKEEQGFTGTIEEIPYDPDTPIYIPTDGFDVTLSVEALNTDGNSIDFSGANGAGIYAGAVDVIAWNTAAPESKISLSHEHFALYEGESLYRDQAYSDYPTGGKRLVHFGETTTGVVSGFPSGILGVTADQDNVIALQVRYANGKASAITYLTIHPVTLSLEGTVAASPTVDESVYGPFNQHTTSGLVTADPGTASIVFAPASGSSTAGLTLHCQEGFITSDGDYSIIGSDEEDPKTDEMTLQSDGTYTWQVPDADAEAYASAVEAHEEDDENNPHPGRYIGIFEPTDAYLDDSSIVPSGYYNIIRDGGQPAGYYVVYATDRYGNMRVIGITKNAVIADASAPIVSEGSITSADGGYTATFRIYDDSLFSFGRDEDWNDKAMSRPMTLTFSYDDDYAAAIGASGESLTLTADASEGTWSWTADTANRLGIYEAEAVLTRSGEYENSTTYYKGAEDVYLTVTVKGIVAPAITSATDMTLNITATDAHGNTAGAAGATASVTGAAPRITAMEYKAIENTPGISDLALIVTFNQPVQPAESWINRSISGYATQWQDSFPITGDGTWDISFTDVFGTVYTPSVDTADYKGSGDSVFGDYGFDLSFSTLDYVAASEGVTIAASYTGADGDSLHIYKGSEMLTPNEGDRLTGRTAVADANGDYLIYLYGESGWSDKIRINLNNIVSGGPEETVYFYIDELKEQYQAGAADQFQGTTTGSVTVSYRTSRETSPVGATTLTIKNGDSGSFAFQYYDAPTDFTYTISGSLSEYGIALNEPETPYEDGEAPAIDLVTVWTQKGSGFVQANAFPGSADEAGIGSAIMDSGTAQGYDFVVNASDYSKWKVVVKTAEPASMSYAAAESDAIPGVSVSGNNVLVTKDIADGFYIVAVDNAAEDSAASADNFTCIKIPYGSYQFDTTAPVIETATVSDSLYAKTVYLKVTDKDDKGNDITSGVTVSGSGIVEEANTVNGVAYQYKLVFTDNDTVVVVTAADAAGNIATANIQVTGIDVTAPVLTVTWSPCFRDPTTGRLDQSNPTAGPVNTDVIAHITSDKEIASVLVNGSVTLDPENTEYEDPLDGDVISYTSQRITVRFKNRNEASYTLAVSAPNGKGTTVTASLREDVIDKQAPYVADTVTPSVREGYSTPYSERHSLSFDEDVYCMNAGTAGEIYSDTNPFVVTLTDNTPQVLQFADKAGNLTTYTVTPGAGAIDRTAPTLTVAVPDEADATNTAVSVNVTADEDCTLTADDATCGTLTQGTDSNGNAVWTGTVSVSRNGTFRLTATDSAGNAKAVTFTVNNIDRTLPVISFDTSTVSLRQDSADSALAELLAVDSESVHTWDNVAIKEGTLDYDASGVLLGTAGIYSVTYTVKDTAGNVGQSVRYVKVIDRYQPVITVDSELTESNGITGVRAGEHTLSVSGLKTANEPYTVQLVKGNWSAGQMKRASGGIAVEEDGSFTLSAAGFYTLYITTQSRQTYRTLLYVEN
ncbi:MAG: hypothetical protein K5855_04960 [Oscillospiraceae bacterium]|nr:hypothetical protein [Oscillospiraceae bacterium]